MMLSSRQFILLTSISGNSGVGVWVAFRSGWGMLVQSQFFVGNSTIDLHKVRFDKEYTNIIDAMCILFAFSDERLNDVKRLLFNLQDLSLKMQFFNVPGKKSIVCFSHLYDVDDRRQYMWSKRAQLSEDFFLFQIQTTL